MEIRKDILWRVYLIYLLMIALSLYIFGKATYIQVVQGKQWRDLSDTLHQKLEETPPERGTIYSEDGEMLSTSIPLFDVFIDFGTKALRVNNGKKFLDSLDLISQGLSTILRDKTEKEIKKELEENFKNKDRHWEIAEKISFRQLQKIKELPILRLDRNRSGITTEERSIRLNPYKTLAFRTIGLDRGGGDTNIRKIGLEAAYDTLLRGVKGKRSVRFIARGVSVPVLGDYEIEPENGKDIYTTLNVFIQGITEYALMKMMEKNNAESGCAIVMETKTGKIKAIANLGESKSGGYFENFNYALTPSEPGSTFKLVTLLSLLEDKKISLNNTVSLNDGEWKVNGSLVKDSEKHNEKLGRDNVTIKEAFELSSNVGLAKIACAAYYNKPSQFLSHLHSLRLDTLTGIDIPSEHNSKIPKPGDISWSNISLPWMAFGYGLEITPLQAITLYNAIANNGRMMRPYLVNDVKDEGLSIKTYSPKPLLEKVCSDSTLLQLQSCLEGVCSDELGTANSLFKNCPYKVAGKTGTAKVANGRLGYKDNVYQSSFIGYFPADRPRYTCLVCIKNKPNAPVFYGAAVAGPVFKEIADRIYQAYINPDTTQLVKHRRADSSNFRNTVSYNDVIQVCNTLGLPVNKGGEGSKYVSVLGSANSVIINPKPIAEAIMPDLSGFGCKDAVFACEQMGLKVSVFGRGRVVGQSINAGNAVRRGRPVKIFFN